MTSEKILVIDKDEKARLVLCDYLTARGFYVISTQAIHEAAPCITKHRPDLVFADLSDADIEKLVKLLRSDKLLAEVVAVSSTESSAKVVSALRAGAADYVLKPFMDAEQLDKVLSKLFERIRLFRLNQHYRKELERANRELNAGIRELKADQSAGLKVQLNMLPEKELTLEQFRFEHMIKPSLYLSGDFLDYFKIDGEKILFYFADVAGHGASSAFVTVLLKNLSNRLLRNVRRGSSADILSPRLYLERVNHELLQTRLGKHVTMFIGIIDHKKRMLTYAVGAHFPMPVIIGKDGVRYIEGVGMPVGLFEKAEFNEYEIPLPEDFGLVMFSDGILEILDDKSLAQKEERLLELVRGGSQTIELLNQGLSLSGLSDLPDDIAILTISEVTKSDVKV
ncbi:MAG: hypothetical protein CSB48_05700 [Proteobacteria bacterium]|nr:MAG: hypothetical protein CSB48_05700 [Pseudomonadota bacterium]